MSFNCAALLLCHHWRPEPSLPRRVLRLRLASHQIMFYMWGLTVAESYLCCIKSIWEHAYTLMHTPFLTSHALHTQRHLHISDGCALTVTISPHTHTYTQHSVSHPPHIDTWLGADQHPFRIASQQHTLVWLPWRIMTPFRSIWKCSLCSQTTVALYCPICIHYNAWMKYQWHSIMSLQV